MEWNVGACVSMLAGVVQYMDSVTVCEIGESGLAGVVRMVQCVDSMTGCEIGESGLARVITQLYIVVTITCRAIK